MQTFLFILALFKNVKRQNTFPIISLEKTWLYTSPFLWQGDLFQVKYALGYTQQLVLTS
jgi:hypothetical protein